MASRFASVTEEQILSIDEAAIPKNTNGIVNLFNLSRYFHFLLSVFVAVLLEINQILADYSACVVYTKTIIHFSVGESGGYLYPALFTSTCVNNC